MALPVVGGADATVQTAKDARRRGVPRPQEGGRQAQDRRGEGEAREDRAALQPGSHRPREDSLPSQCYLSVDVSLPGLAILSSQGKPMKGESRWESCSPPRRPPSTAS